MNKKIIMAAILSAALAPFAQALNLDGIAASVGTKAGPAPIPAADAQPSSLGGYALLPLIEEYEDGRNTVLESEHTSREILARDLVLWKNRLAEEGIRIASTSVYGNYNDTLVRFCIDVRRNAVKSALVPLVEPTEEASVLDSADTLKASGVKVIGVSVVKATAEYHGYGRVYFVPDASVPFKYLEGCYQKAEPEILRSMKQAGLKVVGVENYQPVYIDTGIAVTYWRGGYKLLQSHAQKELDREAAKLRKTPGVTVLYAHLSGSGLESEFYPLPGYVAYIAYVRK